METTPLTPRDAETPRQTRLRLNRMEAWAAKHADTLGPDAVRLRALFELAVTADHADFLAGELRDLAGAHSSHSRQA